MKLGKVSSHARIRMSQRGLSLQALETLLEYGRVEYDHHGGKVVYLNNAGKAMLARILPAGQLDRWTDMYAVLDTQNEVITVGHRTRRILRH
ncbi:MAG: DUF4258 domain-containing protein [Sulfuricella sp.]|nr:DUF4258 domain-containing protein [Sulfuricella sp.]